MELYSTVATPNQPVQEVLGLRWSEGHILVAIAVSGRRGRVQGKVLEAVRAGHHKGLEDVQTQEQEEEVIEQDCNLGADSKLAHHPADLDCQIQKARVEVRMKAEQAIQEYSV